MREQTRRILEAGTDRHRMLGVAVGATAREVKVAYHAISRLGVSPNSLVYNLNPNQEDRLAAQEAFKKLSDAYMALYDPESSPAKRMREEQSEAPSPWSGGDGRPARRQRGQRQRGPDGRHQQEAERQQRRADEQRREQEMTDGEFEQHIRDKHKNKSEKNRQAAIAKERQKRAKRQQQQQPQQQQQQKQQQ